ncbi:MAG: hypothetical protein P0Y55_05155 [Candidatus Cohnella colombiensis]|uniref:DUF4309 domain-containing protein n=1 Tax=Candidatus Cohnella colombiensis TaxID=3121368 RepID=A0AA95JDX2_9BACL|nr:MAG: hypothetical protein P0Y55_05155 [Cohnella sp.]
MLGIRRYVYVLLAVVLVIGVVALSVHNQRNSVENELNLSSPSHTDPQTSEQPSDVATTNTIDDEGSQLSSATNSPDVSHTPTHEQLPDVTVSNDMTQTTEADPGEITTESSITSEVLTASIEKPSLYGIALGDTEATIRKKLGEPQYSYALPDDNDTIQIKEYAGFSIGYNSNNKVAFVEVTSRSIQSGFPGLIIGMTRTDAAAQFGIGTSSDSQVLTVDVTDGWLKLDLDPSTQKVISIKLISSSL